MLGLLGDELIEDQIENDGTVCIMHEIGAHA